MHRAFLCPSGPWLEAAMPDSAEDKSAAEEGSLLHAMIPLAYHGKPTPGLTEEQRGVVDSCVAFLRDVVEEAGGADTCEVCFEVTMSLAGVFERTITADVVVLNHATGEIVVIDWKTGRAEPQTDAGNDLQLWCYVLAARDETEDVAKIPVAKVTAIRFHPRLWDHHRESRVTFESDWGLYRKRLEVIAQRSTPDAERIAGESQCLYCKGRLACPEFAAWTDAATTEIAKVTTNTDLTPERLGQLLALRPQVTAHAKAMKFVEAQAREYMAQGGEIIGPEGEHYGLQEQPQKRTIPDAVQARAALIAKGVPAGAIDACCTMRLGTSKAGPGLDAAIRTVTGCKAKDAKAALADMLGDELQFTTPKDKIVATYDA